jgi:hypothetical protein
MAAPKMEKGQSLRRPLVLINSAGWHYPIAILKSNYGPFTIRSERTHGMRPYRYNNN